MTSPSTTYHQPSTIIRPRRLRAHGWLREMVAETRLHPSDLILPLFVQEHFLQAEPIASLPGQFRHSIPGIIDIAKRAADLGICAIAIFPVVENAKKDNSATEALNPQNLICRTIAQVKAQVPTIGVIADVALDPYTTHGHDGIMRADVVDNDATLPVLAEQALTLARAGTDIVAPSDMMDGRIGTIRAALDGAHQTHVCILSYAAKYASALYGPFRDAVGSSSALGKADKRTYQMNPANAHEAMHEIALDVAQGADMVMIKPALPYLDVIARAAAQCPVPVLAYQVSGEYAMIHAAGEKGALNAHDVMLESLLSIKRAGARAIFTYAALEVARKLT